VTFRFRTVAVPAGSLGRAAGSLPARLIRVQLSWASKPHRTYSKVSFGIVGPYGASALTGARE